MLTSRRKAAIAILAVMVIIVAAVGLEINNGRAARAANTTTTYTTSILVHVGNPSLTSAQAKALTSPNATYSLNILTTPAEIENYKLYSVSNVSSVWLMDYLNGSELDSNWGIEQVVVEANTNQEAQSIYLQMWHPIVEPSSQQIPVNGTYNGMAYSYTFNKLSYRMGFVGIMGNYVTSIVISTENTCINATQLIHAVAGDLRQ